MSDYAQEITRSDVAAAQQQRVVEDKPEHPGAAVRALQEQVDQHNVHHGHHKRREA